MPAERGPVTSEAETDALRALVGAYWSAFEARDLAGCVSLYAEDATLRFLFGSYEGRSAIEEWHRDRFAADVHLVRLEDVTVKDDTVVVQAVATSRRLRLFRIEKV